MRLLLGIVAFLLVVVGIAVAVLVWLAIDNDPLIERRAALSAEQVGRAKRLLDRNDPRHLRHGERRAMVLNQEDVDAAVNYVVHQAVGGSARIVLQPGFADLALTVPLPSNPLGRYANVRLEVMETGRLPRLQSLSIGKLSLPGPVRDIILVHGLKRAGLEDKAAILARMIPQVSFGPHSMRVLYEWQDGAAERLKTAFVPPDEVERLHRYHDVVADVSGKHRDAAMPLSTLLEPVMTLAASRSADGDAAAETRAALIVLAAYVTGGGIELVVPDAHRWDPTLARHVTLRGRDDFAKHFIVSAALAATAGTPLSQAVGLYKELDDSRGGSGFSFNDLAADSAGTQFGRIGTASAASATALQKAVAAGIGEDAIMPVVADLPEFMPEAEFVARFGGVGAPKYQAMMAEIEHRVSALPVATLPAAAQP